MFKAIKKSFSIIIENPVLTMSFVLYLIFLSLILPRLFMGLNIILFALVLILLFTMTAAFFAGWLQMVKVAINNSKKVDKTEEEKLKEFTQMKDEFFGAVPKYILPLLGGIILYIIMFFLLIAFNIKFANHFIGRLDFLVEKINSLPQDAQALHNFLTSLPQEKLMILWSWQFLFVITTGIFNFLMMFWASALYYPEKETSNPLVALKNSLIVIFKHPIRSAALYCFILILGVIFKTFDYLLSTNIVLYFVFMILGIYFWVFVFVLIFDYYESRFYNHCDNGGNLIGQDNSCN